MNKLHKLEVIYVNGTITNVEQLKNEITDFLIPINGYFYDEIVSDDKTETSMYWCILSLSNQEQLELIDTLIDIFPNIQCNIYNKL